MSVGVVGDDSNAPRNFEYLVVNILELAVIATKSRIVVNKTTMASDKPVAVLWSRNPTVQKRSIAGTQNRSRPGFLRGSPLLEWHLNR